MVEFLKIKNIDFEARIEKENKRKLRLERVQENLKNIIIDKATKIAKMKKNKLLIEK